MKGRILAIDYGIKKCGLATTDPLQIVAQPLCTLPTNEVIEYLKRYMAQEPVVAVVVGDPSMHTPEGHPLLQAISVFLTAFSKQFPQIDVYRQDETLTSQKAREIILRSGIGKKKRRDKTLVDKVSAVLILQEYLGHL
ncbi:MAG TPA: Holliday junction resolvase RuvX [Saprospiraceae bacterium]|nr:Holliday junction resolvase RuvX [Saprospiraceae bacterium]